MGYRKVRSLEKALLITTLAVGRGSPTSMKARKRHGQKPIAISIQTAVLVFLTARRPMIKITIILVLSLAICG